MAARSKSSAEVEGEIGDQANQPSSFTFPKRRFGEKRPVYRSFQSSLFKKWPWIHYDQANDKPFCFVCIKASQVGNFKVCASKGEDVFVTRGYTNWKDASGDKQGWFVNHERSQFHTYFADLTLKTHKEVGELISTEHEKQKEINCAYLRKLLENIIFLARQRLPMRGNWVSPDDSEGGGLEQNSNFHQLLLLHGKNDPTVLDIMQHRSRKYTDHHIQNELLQILALGHLCKIATSILESGYFSLEADKVTDTSNKEQLVVCLRWVDSQFEPHEFIGLYHIEDITAETIMAVLKDMINLNLSMCRAQCYDGTNMKLLAREIKAIEPTELYLHCYGHSL